MVARGAPIQANRTLALVRKIYNWGRKKNLVKGNPCVFVDPPTPEVARERQLQSQEIAAFWHALDGERASVSGCLRLLLLLGQRSQEVRLMRWEQLDGDVWVIPKDITKNGTGHVLPLTEWALAIVRDYGNPDSEWVFPSPRKEGAPLRRAALSRRVRALCERHGLKHFTPHDLRRTTMTRLAELRVPYQVRKRILNHKDHSVTAVYDMYEYLDDMREALEAWSGRLEELVTWERRNEVDEVLSMSSTEDVGSAP